MMHSVTQQRRCSIACWLLLSFFCLSITSVDSADYSQYLYYDSGGGSNQQNGNNGNYNRYYNQNNNNYNYNNNNDDANANAYAYNNNDDANAYNNNNNNNDDDANANNNNNNDDANAYAYNDDANANANNDDANANAYNDDANANDNQYDYEYEAVENDDDYNKQFHDDYIEIDLDSFDDVSISPVSCVNYNNGHFIKFEMFETANSYQCHFGQIGTFVVSIAHYMRAYFNYQALTYGKSFSLPDDVGYLNCIPLKMENYGFEYEYEESGSGDGPDRRRAEEEEQDQEQAILYAKVGCMYKETQTSTAFQLHVYTDDKCTEPYSDGQTEQQHAKKGYEINLDEYYAAKLDDDGEIKYTNYPKNTLAFSTKVSFKPSFYKCQTCKPNQISNTFNKFSGTYYDDDFIGKYGMTRSAYNTYLAEKEQEKDKHCDNCQYFTYNTDDARDDYTVQDVDDAYFGTVDDDVSQTFTDDGGNGRRALRVKQPYLAPRQEEFKKYELEFWSDMNAQLSNEGRSLYENSYGGVDEWNMCEQVHKYGMYCDEDCQSLDAFSSNQWSSADIALLSIMCTFMATMMLLIVGKHKRASRTIEKQQSFYSANDYDPNSVIEASRVPGLPPMVMLTIFTAIMLTILALALVNFVNETLVFAVVCCILLFIYMLKITLFSVPKRPVLLASPNHEDVFGYNSPDFEKKGGFFS